MCAPYPFSDIGMISSKFARQGRPICRVMFIGIVCAFSLGCGAIDEQKRANKVKEAVQAFIERMNTYPSPEHQTKWGRSQLSIFGPPLLWKNDIETNTAADSSSYRATADIWYRGTTPEGQSIKEQRTIVMSVNLEGGSEGRVTSYELSEATSLSFWKQLGYWLLWSYLGPLFFLFILGQWSILWQSEPIAALIFMLFLIGAVIWSGIVSYYCFGSGLAVVACIPIFVFVNLFLIGLLRARNRR